MFHPVGHPMERGWVGRVEGDVVVHLAAQTLQSFFTGGGTARAHAEYPLHEVRLLAPVLHPPSIRVFGDQTSFVFANPAAVLGPDAEIDASVELALAPRIAALIGSNGLPEAYTILAEWRDPGLMPPKDRDFAIGLGPVAVTADAFDPDVCVHVVRVDGDERLRQPAVGFDWGAATALAAERTKLYPGDLIAGPSCGLVDGIAAGCAVELVVEAIGVLEASSVARRRRGAGDAARVVAVELVAARGENPAPLRAVRYHVERVLERAAHRGFALDRDP